MAQQYSDYGIDAENGYINRGPSATPGVGYGYNGTAGWKPSKEEWLGYETTTVGPVGNVLNRLNSQNGLISPDPTIMSINEPLRVGRFLVKWLKAPAFFPDAAVKHLRWIFEDMVMEVNGVPENSIDKIDIQQGAVHATVSYPGIYHESGNSVTLKVRECAGSPVRKFIDYWISGVSDRKTGVCHMYGAKMRACLSNMAGSILYVLLGPSCRPEDIEFACMWHEVMPYGEKASHLNSGNIGDAGSGVEMDIEFSGMYDRGPEIDIFARKVVEGYNLYGQTYLNQLMPAYMYDPKLYAATNDEWSLQNSIDIQHKVEQIVSIDKSVEPLNESRKHFFDPYFSRFRSVTRAGTFGEMGIVEGGFAKGIPDRAVIQSSIAGNAT